MTLGKALTRTESELSCVQQDSAFFHCIHYSLALTGNEPLGGTSPRACLHGVAVKTRQGHVCGGAEHSAVTPGALTAVVQEGAVLCPRETLSSQVGRSAVTKSCCPDPGLDMGPEPRPLPRAWGCLSFAFDPTGICPFKIASSGSV